jgi:hypothetical protein
MWAAVRPRFLATDGQRLNPHWDTESKSAHAAVVEWTHLPPKGRAEAAGAGVA